MIRGGLKELERRSQTSKIFGGFRGPGELVEKFKSSLECEELVSKGITGPGKGFDGTGKRLGGFSIHPPPSLRQATLAAAQKRARNGALLPSGPTKLGGNNDIMSALSPIQAAAMAAERILYDDLWCGSHDQSVIDDSEEVVILEQPPSLTTRDGKNTNGGFSNDSAESSTSGFHTAEQGDSSSCRTTDVGVSSLWECSACTLLNQKSVASSRRRTTIRFADIRQKRYSVPLMIGIGLLVLQQLSGVNGILFYAASIFKAAGLTW